MNTIDGLIKSICIFFFGLKLGWDNYDEHLLAGKCLIKRCSTDKEKMEEIVSKTMWDKSHK